MRLRRSLHCRMAIMILVFSDKTKAARLETEINARLAATEAGVATIGRLNLRFEVNPITGKSRFFQDSSAVLVPTPIPFKIHFNTTNQGAVLPVAENPQPFQMTLGWMLGYRAMNGLNGLYSSGTVNGFTNSILLGGYM